MPYPWDNHAKVLLLWTYIRDDKLSKIPTVKQLWHVMLNKTNDEKERYEVITPSG